MKDISWGNLGMRDQYIDWLSRKVIAGWLAAFVFIVGACALVYQAFDGGAGSVTLGVMMLVWLVLVGLTTGVLSYINRRIRSIEVYLDFYERRYDIRHKLFCGKNHFYCVSLHYFKSIRDD